MKKFTVSEDTEVVLNGKRVLLEAGDEIGIPNSSYGNHVGPMISLRDEPWEEAQGIIINAFNDGYRFIVIDDSFMMFKTPPQNTDEGLFKVESEDEALKIALNHWWGIEENENRHDDDPEMSAWINNGFNRPDSEIR